jgi:hypothetical protein
LRCLIEIAMRSDLYHCGAVEFADVRHGYLLIEGSRNPTRSAHDPPVSVRFSVRPIDTSLLERPLRIADFVKRRFVICAIVDASARG